MDIGRRDFWSHCCSDLISTGDGLVAALQVVNALLLSGQTLSQARHGMTKYPQIHQRPCCRNHLDHQLVKDAVSAVKSQLGAKVRSCYVQVGQNLWFA